MSVVGWFIRMLAHSLESIGFMFSGVGHVLRGLLPALLPPEQLTRQVRTRYDTIYDPRSVPAYAEDGDLDAWEADVLDRYHINSGRMLVMGSGCGRETIAIARRGVAAVGVETNPVAVRTAQQFARKTGVSACFYRADFTALPYASASFDFAMLSATMYSAIPGAAGRHAWLTDLGRRLKPGGLAILSFEREGSFSRTRILCERLNAILHKIPGANHAYQPGDSYSVEHYLHLFQDEEELRAELASARVYIRELNWVKRYVIVTFPPQQLET
jgi:SAM-dependent methyltransferase